MQYLNVYYLCCFSYLKYPNEWWQPSWGNIVALMSLFILDIWNSLGEVSQMGETEKEEEVWEKPSNRYVIEEFTQNGGEFRFGLIQTEQNKGLSLHIVPMLCAIGILLLDWRGRERLFVFIKQTVWSSCIWKLIEMLKSWNTLEIELFSSKPESAFWSCFKQMETPAILWPVFSNLPVLALKTAVYNYCIPIQWREFVYYA